MSEKFIGNAIEKFSDTVLRAAHSIVLNRTMAEDIYSDVYFELCKTINCSNYKFANDTHLKAWLIRVAINKAKNLKYSAVSRYSVELHENIAATTNTNTAEGIAQKLDVENALSQLNEKERAIVYLHYYEGYSFKDIAVMLLEPDSTIRSLVKRARDKLKGMLDDSRG